MSLILNFRRDPETSRPAMTQKGRNLTVAIITIRRINDQGWLILYLSISVSKQQTTHRQILQHTNWDLENLVTPVKANVLGDLLIEAQYDRAKTKFLIEGFKNGFSLGYTKNEPVQITAKNLKFTIGDQVDLWNKVMKEVALERYADPYKKLPFTDDFIQSPIGLVPKDNGKDMRLIFHLSYPRTSNG